MAQGMRHGTVLSSPNVCGKEEEKEGAACTEVVVSEVVRSGEWRVVGAEL